jgi:hypothetical protein
MATRSAPLRVLVIEDDRETSDYIAMAASLAGWVYPIGIEM